MCNSLLLQAQLLEPSLRWCSLKSPQGPPETESTTPPGNLGQFYVPQKVLFLVSYLGPDGLSFTHLST